MKLALLTVLMAPQGLDAVVDEIRHAHDVLDYHIAVSIPESGAEFHGATTIRYRIDAESGPLVLDFDSVFTIDSIIDGDGLPLPPARVLDSRLALDYWSHLGDTLSVTIYYHGVPRDGLSIKRNIHGNRSAFADNWPNRAHHWFPSEDHPSDKAMVSYSVEVPSGWEGIANGELIGVEELGSGRRIWRWQTRAPIPVATMVIGAAEMAVTAIGFAAGVSHTVWTFPDDSAYAVDGPFRRIDDIAERLTTLIGPFPYAKLAHVQSATRFGGMENSSAIFYPEQAYADRSVAELTVAHEIAHQWFGDAVTEYDWHHLWLSEGFASYFGPLYYELAGEDSTFVAAMDRNRSRYMSSSVVDRPVIDLAENDLFALLNANNYQKGAWILHMLRTEMGDSAFFRGIRDFYATYRDSTALSSDFATVMQEHAGRDLGWFFEQWLLQPGFPQLQVGWESDGRNIELRVVQVQSEQWGEYQLFLPVEVRLDDGRTHSDVISVRPGQVSSLRIPSLPSAPVEVRWDPGGTLLAEIVAD